MMTGIENTGKEALIQRLPDPFPQSYEHEYLGSFVKEAYGRAPQYPTEEKALERVVTFLVESPATPGVPIALRVCHASVLEDIGSSGRGYVGLVYRRNAIGVVGEGFFDPQDVARLRAEDEQLAFGAGLLVVPHWRARFSRREVHSTDRQGLVALAVRAALVPLYDPPIRALAHRVKLAPFAPMARSLSSLYIPAIATPGPLLDLHDPRTYVRQHRERFAEVAPALRRQLRSVVNGVGSVDQYAQLVLHAVYLPSERKQDILRTSDGSLAILQAVLKATATLGAMDRHELSCVGCGGILGRYGDQMEMGPYGGRLSVVNPGGARFDVVLMSALQNYMPPEGEPVAEYSWWPGYGWSILHCETCRMHVGWKLSRLLPDDSKPDVFYAVPLGHCAFRSIHTHYIQLYLRSQFNALQSQFQEEPSMET